MRGQQFNWSHLCLAVWIQMMPLASSVDFNIWNHGDPQLDTDLTAYSQRGLDCPGLVFGGAIITPVPCEDPECRGISSATPPYRCRKPDGFHRRANANARPLFGCSCCPRVIDCDDPACEGTPDERCQGDLLSFCICRSRVEWECNTDAAREECGQVHFVGRQALIPESAPDVGSHSICPQDPPVKCLDPQCRGSDDWTTSLRCNNPAGVLFIEAVQVNLMDCPCCPEYVSCEVEACSGDTTTRVCLSDALKGCFCDWPSGGGPLEFAPGPINPAEMVNDFEAQFVDRLPSSSTATLRLASSTTFALPPLASFTTRLPQLNMSAYYVIHGSEGRGFEVEGD